MIFENKHIYSFFGIQDLKIYRVTEQVDVLYFGILSNSFETNIFVLE